MDEGGPIQRRCFHSQKERETQPQRCREEPPCDDGGTGSETRQGTPGLLPTTRPEAQAREATLPPPNSGLPAPSKVTERLWRSPSLCRFVAAAPGNEPRRAHCHLRGPDEEGRPGRQVAGLNRHSF